MSERWPSPDELRDRRFAALSAEEKLRWLEKAKRFVRENAGRARDPGSAEPPTK